MTQTITVEIPRQLELLCSPLEITPGQILQGFINDLSLEVHGGNGSDERRMAVEYFLRVGYGAHRYDLDKITQMFEELEYLRLQWTGNDPEMQKVYRRYKKVFLKKWREKWAKSRKSGG